MSNHDSLSPCTPFVEVDVSLSVVQSTVGEYEAAVYVQVHLIGELDVDITVTVHTSDGTGKTITLTVFSEMQFCFIM